MDNSDLKFSEEHLKIKQQKISMQGAYTQNVNTRTLLTFQQEDDESQLEFTLQPNNIMIRQDKKVT